MAHRGVVHSGHRLLSWRGLFGRRHGVTHGRVIHAAGLLLGRLGRCSMAHGGVVHLGRRLRARRGPRPLRPPVPHGGALTLPPPLPGPRRLSALLIPPLVPPRPVTLHHPPPPPRHPARTSTTPSA